MREREVRYYKSYRDDFEKSACQDFQLPSDYKWVRKDWISVVCSCFIYALAIVFSFFYCTFFLHMKIKGREKFKGIKKGCYIYGNHTQALGDVFIPALCAFPKRIYTVAGTANYGIPFIGKLLPYLGALPSVSSFKGIKNLTEAMKIRLKGGHPIVIYPEAHVWEYYTKIRPFPATSFGFPVKFDCPAFAMTVTYQKSKIFKRPAMTVYIDGPFFGEGSTSKEKTANLHSKIIKTMENRSLCSNTEYIRYEPAKSQ